MPNSIVLDAAIRYAARGWPVFPLNPNGKAPHRELPEMPPGEGGLYLATTNLDQVEKWFTQCPDANIGIACGATNGYDGPWVLDVDNKQGKHGTDDLQALEQQHGLLPTTATVFTPNSGEHRYFANDPRTQGKVNGKLYGHASLDIQGTGCYVVTPPSTIDGKPYVEDTICPFATTPLAKLPQWIIDGMRDKPADVAPVPPSGKPLDAVHALTISKHMQGVLLHGGILNEYAHPDGTTDRSAMIAALESALVRAEYGDEDIILLLMDPQHKGGAKAHEQGADWLRADIARIRAHVKIGREEGSNAQEEKTAEESAYNLDAQGILDQLSEAEEPDASVVWDNLATLAQLAMADWSQFKNGCKAILQGEINLNDLDKARSDVRRQRTRHASVGISATPDIHITTDIRVVVDQAQAAMIDQSATPDLFSRGASLVFIAQAGTSLAALIRPPDAPVIVEATKAYLRERMASSAQFLKYDAKHDDWVAALPPEWVPDTLKARGSWDFPVLEGLLSSPTMRLDGSILETPGYDAATGLFLMLNDVQFPAIPNEPTKVDAQDAAQALLEVFVDFPFQHEYHRSAALAALLSLVGRYAIKGNVPLFAISASTRGSGKGKLVDAISIIATGRNAPMWPETTDDEEERKRLLTLAMEGDALVLIDNITHPLGSPALEAALTSPIFKDRILGKHGSKEAPMSAVFFATGNNMTYQGDSARRVIPIYLAPTMERPEEREDFLHPHLFAWLEKERPRLVSAALIILRAYHVAGRPKQPGIKQIGSFEEWNDLVRSALVWTGQNDPAAGRLNLEAEDDAGYSELVTLLDCWQECFGEKAITLKEAIRDAKGNGVNKHDIPPKPPNKWDDLLDALSTLDPRYDGTRLNAITIGNRLKKIQQRVLGTRQLQRDPATKYGTPWKVKCLTTIAETTQNGEAGEAGEANFPLAKSKHTYPSGKKEVEGLGIQDITVGNASPASPASPDDDPDLIISVDNVPKKLDDTTPCREPGCEGTIHHVGNSWDCDRAGCLAHWKDSEG